MHSQYHMFVHTITNRNRCSCRSKALRKASHTSVELNSKHAFTVRAHKDTNFIQSGGNQSSTIRQAGINPQGMRDFLRYKLVPSQSTKSATEEKFIRENGKMRIKEKRGIKPQKKEENRQRIVSSVPVGGNIRKQQCRHLPSADNKINILSLF